MSHGPTGQDSFQWRRLLTSFDKASINLRKTVARLAYRIATEVLPNTSLEAYNNSRLILLDKCPSVQPIGIGEILRRIIGRCISSCQGAEAERIGGNFQLCFGETAGIEHTIHALRREFKKENCEAILLIDATNAFNLLNRTTALENVRRMSPSLYIPPSNTYQTTSSLFVDKSAFFSQKSCTPGDPIAMLMYGIAKKPLILNLQTPKIVQKWYADGGNAAGSLQQQPELFENLSH